MMLSTPMRCTVCECSLTTYQFDQDTVHACSACRGLLFERHALMRIVERDLPLDIASETPITHDIIRPKRNPDRPCPKCDAPFREFNYGHKVQDEYVNTDIVINSCEQCQLVWLEAGELRAIKDLLGFKTTPSGFIAELNQAETSLMDQGMGCCPACQAVPLTESAYYDVAIESCPRCQGIWLEKESFNAILAKHFREDIGSKVFEETASRRACPRCMERLIPAHYQGALSLTVDHCLSCLGLFWEKEAFNRLVKGLEAGL